MKLRVAISCKMMLMFPSAQHRILYSIVFLLVSLNLNVFLFVSYFFCGALYVKAA